MPGPRIKGPSRQVFASEDVFSSNFTKGFQVGLQSDSTANAFKGIQQGVQLAGQVGSFINEFGPEGIERRRIQTEAAKAALEINKTKAQQASIQREFNIKNQDLIEAQKLGELLNAKTKTELASKQQKEVNNLYKDISLAGGDVQALQRIANKYPLALQDKNGASIFQSALIQAAPRNQSDRDLISSLRDLASGKQVSQQKLDLDRDRLGLDQEKLNLRRQQGGGTGSNNLTRTQQQAASIIARDVSSQLQGKQSRISDDGNAVQIFDSNGNILNSITRESLREKAENAGIGGQTAAIAADSVFRRLSSSRPQTNDTQPSFEGGGQSPTSSSPSVSAGPSLSLGQRDVPVTGRQSGQISRSERVVQATFQGQAFDNLRRQITGLSEPSPVADAITNIVADALTDSNVSTSESGKLLGVTFKQGSIRSKIKSLFRDLPKEQRPSQKQINNLIENAIQVAELRARQMETSLREFDKFEREKQKAVEQADLAAVLSGG